MAKGDRLYKMQRPAERRGGKVGEFREPLDLDASRAILSQARQNLWREGAETKRLLPKADSLFISRQAKVMR